MLSKKLQMFNEGTCDDADEGNIFVWRKVLLILFSFNAVKELPLYLSLEPYFYDIHAVRNVRQSLCEFFESICFYI